MKRSELLKKAKNTLAKNERGYYGTARHKYICLAVTDVSGSSVRTKESLRKWIAELLNGYIFYEPWLRDYHSEIYSKMNFEDIQEARHQWLDWMIAYWEAKGE